MKTNQQTMGPNARGNDRRRQYRKDRQFSRATFLRRWPKNADLTALLQHNLERIGGPEFSDDEMLFARRLKTPLTEQFGTQFPLAIDDRITMRA